MRYFCSKLNFYNHPTDLTHILIQKREDLKETALERRLRHEQLLRERDAELEKIRRRKDEERRDREEERRKKQERDE